MNPHRPAHGGYPGAVRPTAQPGLTIWGLPVTIDPTLGRDEVRIAQEVKIAPGLLEERPPLAQVVDELVREARLADKTPLSVNVRSVPTAFDTPEGRERIARLEARQRAARADLTPGERDLVDRIEAELEAAAIGYTIPAEDLEL